jgi:hypothetical protein
MSRSGGFYVSVVKQDSKASSLRSGPTRLATVRGGGWFGRHQDAARSEPLEPWTRRFVELLTPESSRCRPTSICGNPFRHPTDVRRCPTGLGARVAPLIAARFHRFAFLSEVFGQS